MFNTVPRFGPGSPIPSEFDSLARPMGRWISEIQRLRLVPWLHGSTVMETPPTVVSGDYEGVASVTSVAAGGSGYVVGEEITVTGGTAVLQAILRVATVSGGAVTSATVIRGGIYSANPSNPVAQGSASASGTGATFNLSFTARGAGNINSRVAGGTTDAKVRWNVVEPRSSVVGGDYTGSSAYIGTGSAFEFYTDALQINTHLLPFNGGFNVFVDGERVAATQYLTPSSTTPFFAMTFATRRIRHIKFVGTNLAISNLYLDTAASVWAPPEPKTVPAIFMGDSYVHGTGAADGPGTDLVSIFGQVTGWDVLGTGIGSTGYNSTSTSAFSARITNDILKRGVRPHVVIVGLGYNDAAGNMTTLEANALAGYQLLRAGLPNALIIVLGPWTPQGSTAGLVSVGTAIQAAVAAANDNRIVYMPIVDLVNATNKTLYTDVDNVHPNPAGHNFLGVRLGVSALALAA
jgi:lysophospholipase L1-like esterase